MFECTYMCAISKYENRYSNLFLFSMSGRIAIELKKTSVLLEVIGLHLSKRFHHCPHITKKGCWEWSIWRSRCLEFGLTKDICFVQSTSLRVEDPSFQTSGVAVVVQQRLNQCNLWLRNMRNRKPIYIYTYIRGIIDDEDGVGGSGSWFWFLGHDWWYQCQWWCHWCWWL